MLKVLDSPERTASSVENIKNLDLSTDALASDNLSIRGLSSSDVWDHENAFYWFSHPTRLNKMLAHYELYKSILELPGHIVELGVYKGASLIRLATFRNALENDFSRKIIGFDAFGKFPQENLETENDLRFIRGFEGAGGNGLSVEELSGILRRKAFQNVALVKGNVFQTIPKYLADHPETRIAFLHLDMDVQEPTIFALNELYDRVVPGGIIVFDDYNSVAGETLAVDQFVALKKIKLQKLHFYNVPTYVRKPV
ncbi:MAG TPA: TylF/MycF/NovP-related O-methyltransferase [Terriglobales bacterium]|jgi:SAM-dependent methyltransferase